LRELKQNKLARSHLQPTEQLILLRQKLQTEKGLLNVHPSHQIDIGSMSES
jgi:hypothetical protein